MYDSNKLIANNQIDVSDAPFQSIMSGRLMLNLTHFRSLMACIAISMTSHIATAASNQAQQTPGPNQLQSQQITFTLTLKQAKPVLKVIERSDTEVGRETIFGAHLSDTSGQPMGLIEGVVITELSLIKASSDVLHHRSLTFMLAGGQIEAEGSSYYPQNHVEMAINQPTTIAVIGGTGKFIGASGEVTTTHLANDEISTPLSWCVFKNAMQYLRSHNAHS